MAAALGATRGELWLTETGGIVARRNGSRVRLPGSTTENVTYQQRRQIHQASRRVIIAKPAATGQ